MEYSFVIEGRPKPKERPRVTRGGRTFTPKATLEAEALIRQAYDGPLFEGPVAITTMFRPDKTLVLIGDEEWWGTSPLRGDIDNYVKTVLDGLQGVAYENDRQVVRLGAVKA